MKNSIHHSSETILYRTGAIAPLISLALYLSQFLLIFTGETYPTTPDSWFILFHRNILLGLFMLNALDIISIAILGIMFLGIHNVFKETQPALISIATYLAFLGIAMFVSNRTQAVSATHSLSMLYAEAGTQALKDELVSAGYAAHAITRATPETFGFLFIAIAGLIISLIIMQNTLMKRYVGYIGIMAFIFTVANDMSLVIFPSVARIIMPLNGILWLIWWLMMSRELWRLAKPSAAIQAG